MYARKQKSRLQSTCPSLEYTFTVLFFEMVETPFSVYCHLEAASFMTGDLHLRHEQGAVFVASEKSV
jgi:hypothetical protein